MGGTGNVDSNSVAGAFRVRGAVVGNFNNFIRSDRFGVFGKMAFGITSFCCTPK